jgi:hypothetical protein
MGSAMLFRRKFRPRPRTYRDYGRTTVNYRAIAARYHPKKCVACKSTGYLEVHHRDWNSHNNHPENLEWRCRPCHLAVHGKRVQRRTWMESGAKSGGGFWTWKKLLVIGVLLLILAV